MEFDRYIHIRFSCSLFSLSELISYNRSGSIHDSPPQQKESAHDKDGLNLCLYTMVIVVLTIKLKNSNDNEDNIQTRTIIENLT